LVVKISETTATNISKNPRVDYVMENAAIEPSSTTVQQQTLTTVQPNPPNWGLDRIDQRVLPMDNQHSFTRTGKGVTAYVIDSGINFTHQDFGGRAIKGYDYFYQTAGNPNHPNAGLDFFGGTAGNGHGSGVAGVLGGTTHGVAKGVTLVAVRVSGNDEENLELGSGTVTSLVSGIDWATAHHTQAVISNSPAPVPAVANISINLKGNDVAPINTAVQGLINSGVTCVVSAGNFNEDASLSAPGGQVAAAITVGASTRLDERTYYSNFGPSVDIFAPGGDNRPGQSGGILLLSRKSNSATYLGEGTSFAAPYVAGAAALYLETNPSATPAQVRFTLVALATSNKIITNNQPGTTQKLLFSTPGNPTASLAIVNGASNQWGSLAPDSWVVASSIDPIAAPLSTTTVSSSSNPLPTSLGGTTVQVQDSLGVIRFAPITSVSPAKVSYVVPNGTVNGPATVTITNGNGFNYASLLFVSNVGPGVFFTPNGSGSDVASGYILRIKSNGTQTYEPIAQCNAAQTQCNFVPIDLGPVGDLVYLVQYATGFRNRSSLANVTTNIVSGTGAFALVANAPVSYAGPLPLSAGVDQINSGSIPRSLIGKGIVNVVNQVDGKTANTVKIQIQ
jgi:uncharacterized protein (TIGR03437 family)